MSAYTMARVIACAERLIGAVEEARLATSFDEEGNGPDMALVDQVGFDSTRPGPIRKRAAELKQALLDHESSERAGGGR